MAVAVLGLLGLLAGCGTGEDTVYAWTGAGLTCSEAAEALDWVSIPGGTFQMGSTAGSDEQPPHGVNVPGFQMARTEVTVCQYEACQRAGACTDPHGSEASGDKPVVYVDWSQSRAFCAWAGGRLCSEAEWEYAARRGSAADVYPWGDDAPTCDRAVYSGCGGLAVPCSKLAGNNEWGVCDLSGNVWEWVEDDYHSSYTGAASDGSAWVDSPNRAADRVGRGGSFGYGAAGLRGASRGFGHPSDGGYDLGARCCRSP